LVSQCVGNALAAGALKASVDSIGLIPGGGGAKSIARRLGNLRGYRGAVADNYGKRAIGRTQGVSDVNSIVGYLNGGDAAGLALDVAGFVPVLGQVAAVASIVKDGYDTYKEIQSCP
jgi:hypothetical protein